MWALNIALTSSALTGEVTGEVEVACISHVDMWSRGAM
jgi:hypothetical protein